MFCKECGTQLPDNAQFCTNCGAKTGNTMPVETTASSPPKRNTPIIIGTASILVLVVAVGVFLITKNQPSKSSNVDAAIQEPLQHEDISSEYVLNAGTYVNELDRITIAKDVSGQYSFNMTGYDESGKFLLFSGSIDNDNGNYIGNISHDESGSFIDKKFSIMPTDNSITISSDDDTLLFLCVQYQYLSEVDALEDNANGYDTDNMINSNVAEDTLLKEGYYGYTSNDIEHMLFIYSDNTFAITVTENSASVLFCEGAFHNNGNDTYKADITICSDDFMRNQTIDISVIDENTLSLSAEYIQLNNIIQGTYQFGSSSLDNDTLLQSEENLSKVYEQIPYVPITMSIIGMESEIYLENTAERIDLPTNYLQARFSSVFPLITNNNETTYYGYYERGIVQGVNDIYMIGFDENGYITTYGFSPQDTYFDMNVILDELGISNTEPYIAYSDVSESLLIWRLDNAYLIMSAIGYYYNSGFVPMSTTSMTIAQEINGKYLGLE